MRLPPIIYHKPSSLSEALDFLARQGQAATVMGGGTALINSLRHRLVEPEYVIALDHLPELCSTQEFADHMEIGSATTLRTILASDILRQKAPLLLQAAAEVASAQVRNAATLGGNICLDTRCVYYNRSAEWRTVLKSCFKLGGEICHAVKRAKGCQAVFSSDLAPALLALDATLLLETKEQKRTIPLADFYSGKGENPLALNAGEILTRIRIPLPGGRSSSSYVKLANRQAVDFPMLSVAVHVRWADGGAGVEDIRIVLGAISSLPLRMREAENLLKKEGLSAAPIERAAALAYQEAKPVPNTVLSAAYRKKMVRAYTQRAILEACRRGGIRLI